MMFMKRDVKVFTVSDIKGLDPITIYLEDVAPRQGKLVIECYGECWTAYWSGMGDHTLLQFLFSCDSHYVNNKIAPIYKTTKAQEAYRLRVVEAVLSALKEVPHEIIQ